MHNPTSGDSKIDDGDLRRALEDAGHQVRYQSTKKKRAKVSGALGDANELVVVAGGDGTIKKIACLVAASDASAPLGIIPLGTANNIGKTLGILGSTSEIVASWRTAARVPLDLGVVRAPWGQERFLESVGGGIFTRLMARGADEVEENAAGLVGNEIDRGLQLLRAIVASEQARPWRVVVDGEDRSGSYLAVEVMNIRFVGPNIPLAPAADPGDGTLEVVVITDDDRAALLDYLDARLTTGSARAPALATWPAREVRLMPPGGRVHIDDEIHPASPVEAPAGEITIIVDPGALAVLVPRR